MRIGLYNARVGTYATGGTETFLREMAGQLCRNHEVVIYTGDGEIISELRGLDVRIRTVPFACEGTRVTDFAASVTPLHAHEIESLTMYLHARRKGLFEQMATEVDVISTHSLLDNALVSGYAPVPVVFRVAGIRNGSTRWRWLLRRDHSTLRLANSEATANRLQEWLDADTDGVVYAGLDLDQFSPDGSTVARPETSLILYLGRLDEGKGLFDLLNAVAGLRDTREVQLRVVGDGELRDDLERRAESLGIADAVEFVGTIPHSQVQEYYRGADVYCLPSYSEGFPLGNIEAMACKTPVVSTDIEPVREQITHGETGLLVNPGDVSALGTELGRLLDDPSLRTQLAERAYEWVQRLSWEKQASVLGEYYRQAIDTATNG